MISRIVKWSAVSLVLVVAGGTSCPIDPGGSTTGFPKTAAWTQRTVNTGAGLRPVFTTTADFDTDTKLDVIAAYQGQDATLPAVIIFFQNTTTDFTAVTIGSGADLASVSVLAVADLDGDAHFDVVAGCDSALVYFHSPSNPRTAADWARTTVDNSTGSQVGVWNDVAIGDIDAANGPDIVACNPNFGRWSWFRSPAANIATGTGWTRFDIDNAAREGAAGVALADFNADSKLDVISTSQDANVDPRIAWYRNPTDPTAIADWTKSRVGNLSAASRVAIADLNADGRSDVIALNRAGRQIGWYQRPSDATTAWSGFLLTQFTSAAPVDVKAADIDGNGQVDIVVGTSTAGMFRWFTPNPGSAQTAQWIENNVIDLGSGLTPGRFALGDIDGDARPDVVAPIQGTSTSQDTIIWLENPQ